MRGPKSWCNQIGLRYQYINRIVRALFLRLLLACCLPFFSVWRRLNRERKTHRRVLVIVIGGLGDCLLFDSLFRRIKERWPDSRVDVLSGSFAQMWSVMASVDNLILFTPTKFKSPWSYIRLFFEIHRNRYDVVAEGIAFLPRRGIYPVLTSLVLTASRAPVRIGRKNTGRIGLMRQHELGFIGSREMRRKKAGSADKKNRYLTHELEIPPPDQRTCHESAFIFSSQGIRYHRHIDEPSLANDPTDDLWAKQKIRSLRASENDIIVGLTLETTRVIKTWPLDHFHEIVEKGLADDLAFVLIGLDQQKAGALTACFPNGKILDMTGQTSLGQMISVIRQCDLFVSGDTGPAHIAQACRIPTIVLFGPSNEKEFGPVDKQLHTLILPPGNPSCRPCVLGPCIRERSCIHSITAQRVYDEITKKMNDFYPHRKHAPSRVRQQPQRILCVV